jgi:hypothetical protein
MKNAVFWDVTPCGSCKTNVSEERSASIFVEINRELSASKLLTLFVAP